MWSCALPVKWVDLSQSPRTIPRITQVELSQRPEPEPQPAEDRWAYSW